MGRLGDLLELIETAPVGVHTLTGSLWRWTHHERARVAVDGDDDVLQTRLEHRTRGVPVVTTYASAVEAFRVLDGRARGFAVGRASPDLATLGLRSGARPS